MLRTILPILLISAFAAYADPVVTLGGTTMPNEGQYSLRPGVTMINFNTGNPSQGFLTYTLNPGNLVTGSQSGQYAAPTGDNTRYLTVGPGPGTQVTIESGSLLNYFGFYASSVDDYNIITFYRDATAVFTLNGTTLATLGGFSPNGQISTFVNIDSSNPGEYFNRIVLSSNTPAFETDNHAFGLAPSSNVPEPSAAGLSVGLAALVLSAGRLRLLRK